MRSLSGLTLFCDFDGPIIDVSERYYETYLLGLTEIQAIYQTRGLTLPIHRLSKAQFWDMKQNRVPDVEIAMRSGLQGEQIEAFLKRVVEIVNRPDLLQKDTLQPGARWALSLLRAQGARLVLVTLRCRDQATQILEAHGLADLFSGIWGTQDASAAYANQAEHKTGLLAQAIALTGSSADAAWMVGDTEADVIAGQTASIPTIALTCGIRSQSYLKKFEPTRLHSDLLSAVHYLVYHSEHCSMSVA
ncbi:MAG: hypothetical protein Fur0046_39660 [Cyanobacteria bacterium J069]